MNLEEWLHRLVLNSLSVVEQGIIKYIFEGVIKRLSPKICYCVYFFQSAKEKQSLKALKGFNI